jgi:hypothetical protein
MAQGSLKRHNANIIQFGESEIDGQLREYFNDLDALTNRALRGRLPEDDFRRELERLTLPLVLSAFLLVSLLSFLPVVVWMSQERKTN